MVIRKPQISVIIPVYNKARELSKCLYTVCNQSLTDLEILCVDDGSTDSSWEVLRAYQEKDSRIKLYYQRNQGVAFARNLALREAKGDFIAFMDPDDLYPDNEALKRLYNAAQLSGLPIAGGNFEKLLPDGKRKLGLPQQSPGVYVYSKAPFNFGFWRFIYDRRLLVGNKIFFPPYRRYQDPPFLMRAMMQSDAYALVAEPVYRYRVAPANSNRICWEADDWRRVRDLLLGVSEVVKLAKQFHLSTLIEGEVTHLIGYPWSLFNILPLYDKVFEFKEFKTLRLLLPESEAIRLVNGILAFRDAAKRSNNSEIKRGNSSTAHFQEGKSRIKFIRGIVKCCIPYGVMRWWLRKRYKIELP